MSRWIPKIRTVILVTLTVLAIGTGGLLVASYLPTPPSYERSLRMLPGTAGVFLSEEALRASICRVLLDSEPRGVRSWFGKGVLVVTYKCPIAMGAQKDTTFIGSVVSWFRNFDATAICSKCGYRFRDEGDSCARFPEFIHMAAINWKEPATVAKWNAGVINWNSSVYRVTQTNRIMLVLWFPFLLFAALPSFVLIRGVIRRRRRRKNHQCLGCGYLLIGNTSGVCPECGKGVSDASIRSVAEVE